jgi:hypothetical protein
MSWTSVTTHIICLQCSESFGADNEDPAFNHSSEYLHDIKFIYHDEYTMSAIEALIESEEDESVELAWHVSYSDMRSLLEQAHGGARPSDLIRALNMNTELLEHESNQQMEG